MMLVGNTLEIFNESGQHSYYDVHRPAQAATAFVSAGGVCVHAETTIKVHERKLRKTLWLLQQTLG
jgi:hypothetical protein